MNFMHLDNHALRVDERHMHRTAYLKAQHKQARRIQGAYEAIAEDRAQTFIEQVRSGDLSFGAGQEALDGSAGGLAAPLQLPAAGHTSSSVWPADVGRP